MPHANIWVRRDNEERWNKITDKSAWVNAMLEKSPPNSKVIAEKLEPVQEAHGNDMWPEKVDPAKDYSVCKHGQIKGFCKLGCK